MTARAFAFALFLAGCTTRSATEPAPEETFTLETNPAAVNNAVEESPADAPFGSSPWTGRLQHLTHRYSHGCTDWREVEVIALVIDKRPVPIILGWRRISTQDRGEPHFLSREEELPPSARSNACVTVTGADVVYAHEGYIGMPAHALQATRIDPAPCP